MYYIVCTFKTMKYTLFLCAEGGKYEPINANRMFKKEAWRNISLVYAIKNEINIKEGDYIKKVMSM